MRSKAFVVVVRVQVVASSFVLHVEHEIIWNGYDVLLDNHQHDCNGTNSAILQTGGEFGGLASP